MRLPRFSDKVKDWGTVAAVGILAALVAVCLVATFIIVSQHNGDLKKITAQNSTIIGLEHQVLVLHDQGVTATNRLDAETKVVAQYAAALKAEVATSHDISAGYEQAICASIPGCVLPALSSP